MKCADAEEVQVLLAEAGIEAHGALDVGDAAVAARRA